MNKSYRLSLLSTVLATTVSASMITSSAETPKNQEVLICAENKAHNDIFLNNSEFHITISNSYKNISEDLINKNMEKLYIMSSLDYNWDGCSGEPFSKELINKVRFLLNKLTDHQPNIFPTADSDIQLEFYNGEKKYLQFVISNNSVEIYQTDGENFDNDFFDEQEYNTDLIINMVNDFYNDTIRRAVTAYG